MFTKTEKKIMKIISEKFGLDVSIIRREILISIEKRRTFEDAVIILIGELVACTQRF